MLSSLLFMRYLSVWFCLVYTKLVILQFLIVRLMFRTVSYRTGCVLCVFRNHCCRSYECYQVFCVKMVQKELSLHVPPLDPNMLCQSLFHSVQQHSRPLPIVMQVFIAISQLTARLTTSDHTHILSTLCNVSTIVRASLQPADHIPQLHAYRPNSFDIPARLWSSAAEFFIK